ncbi:hypothetical protein PAPYR_552 [Paratrimastix pyriformis]|uniref:Uncharacterized protein n=1 Tax=Paratrimastix pyriformis TaxID=342808 RepID=A0ABQ8UYW7_9EUKA|nr:hypothetical protein PAPYR_552 [Paratrimastix pyriformis]
MPDLKPPTTDALAALVGPCKNLRKLAFPKGWMDFDGAKQAGWVDEAFGGHTQLAVLDLPSFPATEPDIERILSHLPGLVELTVYPRLHMSTRLLAALARSCPGLQRLRFSVVTDPQPDFAALGPLSGVLNELDIQFGSTCEESLIALVPTLTAVTSLNLPPRCPPAALEPIASHLTSLELGGVLSEEKDLPGPWLCHLEALSLGLATTSLLAPLARLLAANQATLRRLTLSCGAPDAPSLMVALRTLSNLTHLELSMPLARCSLSALLPPDLVDRLERLYLCVRAADDSFLIASSRLKSLRMMVMDTAPCPGLALDCPALVELNLSGIPNCRLTSLRCPRLRSFLGSGKSLAGAALLMPMPALEVVDFGSASSLNDPAWLLAGSPPPRLRELSGVRLTRPDLLASLSTSGSLVLLKELHLDVARFPNPLVLRLPGQLEQLVLHIEGERAAGGESQLPRVDLQVEAPGLLEFFLDIHGNDFKSSVGVWLRNCPRLAHLSFGSSISSVSLQTDDEEGAPQLLDLWAPNGDFDASMLGLLTRHGARLRDIEFKGAAPEVWPQLMMALSGLPRLTSLTINRFWASFPLLLACPQLRTLSVPGLPEETNVVLACPMLERIGGIRDPSRQLVLALPAPNLRL